MNEIVLKNIDRTSPEMLAARRQDLLKDLESFAGLANRERVHELLGLPQEIDEAQLQKVPNYRALLKSKLKALAGTEADEAPESGEREFAAAQLLGGIDAYDRLEDEAKEAAA